MSGAPVIELDDVFVLYRGLRQDVAALRGLSLRVDQGERIVIHGPSGAGKSTFVQLVTAAVVPSAGSAWLLGRELSALDDRARRQLRGDAIGIITQHSGDDLSPELTCLDNVALQPRVMGWSLAQSLEAARAALHAVGLAGFDHRRPADLSHGELQRVGIAAALAHRPTLIVADEPTGQLDRVTADAVLDLMVTAAATVGATLIVATHDPAAGRIADRVLTIADGRLSTERRAGEADDCLVVDRRGWVRLPVERGPVSSRVRVEHDGDALVLSPLDAPARAQATATEAPATDGAPVVVLDAASYAVAGAVAGAVVLSPTTATLRSGHLHAITGRSGSGKTTLLALISGWMAPTSGTVSTIGDGQANAAVCPAAPVFPDGLSVVEALQLSVSIRRATADPLKLLRDLGLADLAGRMVGELSGGERQRLAIGRCLASGSCLLLLDEPTAQLDRLSADRVVALLLAVARHGAAVVCATHDAGLIAAADVVIPLG